MDEPILFRINHNYGALLAGRDVPDYSRSTAAAVTVEVSTAESDFDTVRFVSYEGGQASRLPLVQVRLLHILPPQVQLAAHL